MNQQTFELPDNHSYFFPARGGILAFMGKCFCHIIPFVLGEKLHHP